MTPDQAAIYRAMIPAQRMLVRDVLPDVVLKDREVRRREISDRIAVRIDDADINRHERDASFEWDGRAGLLDLGGLRRQPHD